MTQILSDAERSIERLTEFTEIAEVDLEALQKDEQIYQSWSETNTQKRALEFLLGMREKERLSSRITDVISTCSQLISIWPINNFFAFRLVREESCCS